MSGKVSKQIVGIAVLIIAFIFTFQNCSKQVGNKGLTTTTTSTEPPVATQSTSPDVKDNTTVIARDLTEEELAVITAQIREEYLSILEQAGLPKSFEEYQQRVIDIQVAVLDSLLKDGVVISQENLESFVETIRSELADTIEEEDLKRQLAEQEEELAKTQMDAAAKSLRAMQRKAQTFSTAYEVSCLVEDGGLKCWGYQYQLIFGGTDGGSGKTYNYSEVGFIKGMEAQTGVTYVEVIHNATYQPSICAIQNGDLICWGNATGHVLGLNTTSPPIKEPGALTLPNPAHVPDGVKATVIAVSGAYNTVCAIVNIPKLSQEDHADHDHQHGHGPGEGDLYCWGQNYSYGKTGQNPQSTSLNSYLPRPVRIISSGKVTDISLGNDHACAINNNKLFCWGKNNHGQLGNNTTTVEKYGPPSQSVFESEASLHLNVTKVDKVSAGYDHTCALAQGNIYCWGYNYYGQVGVGNDSTKEIRPKMVLNLHHTDMTDIVAGHEHSCALSVAGAVHCWGRTHYKALGRDEGLNDYEATGVYKIRIPVPNGDLTKDVVSLHGHSKNSYNTCAILTSGEIKCWGRSYRRSIGQVTTTNVIEYDEPVNPLTL